jgi:hypothetical protein
MGAVSLPLKIWFDRQPGLPFSPVVDFMGYLSLVGYEGLYLLIPFAHVSIGRWQQIHSKNRVLKRVCS